MDPESKLMHLSHAFCNIMFLIWKEIQRGQNETTQD
jgi:hypothetical protein